MNRRSRSDATTVDYDVNGDGLWNGQKRFACRSHGKSRKITDKEFAARRRVGHFS